MPLLELLISFATAVLIFLFMVVGLVMYYLYGDITLYGIGIRTMCAPRVDLLLLFVGVVLV